MKPVKTHNKPSPIVKSIVRKLALAYAREHRGSQFTRVGESFYERIGQSTIRAIYAEIDKTPSRGRTLQ